MEKCVYESSVREFAVRVFAEVPLMAHGCESALVVVIRVRKKEGKLTREREF